MTELKDSTKIKVESAVVAVEEREISLVSAFNSMPKWKRLTTLALLISIIPLYLIARIGVEQYMLKQYQKTAVVAKQAFTQSLPPEIGDLKLILNANGIYSAYAEVANPNLELSATSISYQAKFKDSNGTVVQTSSGSFYLLPDERKFIVIPRIQSTVPVASGELTVGDVNWQKKTKIPEVNIRISEPFLYDETNPSSFVVEGSVINQSPYTLQSVRIVFVLYDNNDKIIGVSQRDENNVVAYGRRAYKQVWPGLYRTDVAKVRVIPYTNSLDPKNLLVE